MNNRDRIINQFEYPDAFDRIPKRPDIIGFALIVLFIIGVIGYSIHGLVSEYERVSQMREERK